MPFNQRSGQGLSEYLVLLMLVVVVAIPATRSLGHLLKAKLSQIRTELNKEVSQYKDADP